MSQKGGGGGGGSPLFYLPHVAAAGIGLGVLTGSWALAYWTILAVLVAAGLSLFAGGKPPDKPKSA